MRRLSATSQRLEEAIKDAVALSKTRRPSLTRWEEPLNLPASFSRADLRARGIDRFVIHPDSYLKVHHPRFTTSPTFVASRACARICTLSISRTSILARCAARRLSSSSL